jgi:uncharacterized glyoxalase superfamily protein PhnB
MSVADLDRQVTWYRDTLGFTVSARVFLELLQWPGSRSRAKAAPGTTDSVEIHGFFKSGLTVANVAALYQHFRTKGLTFDYELRQHPDGSRSFGLRDPEGNLWQFFGPPE